MSGMRDWAEEHVKSREGFVYPGHAVPLALAIMRRYPSAAEAMVKGNQFPRALEDGLIPGGGSSVYYALNMLRRAAADEITLEAALEAADAAWVEECRGQDGEGQERLQEGREGVAKVMPTFLETFEAWKRSASIETAPAP